MEILHIKFGDLSYSSELIAETDVIASKFLPILIRIVLIIVTLYLLLLLLKNPNGKSKKKKNSKSQRTSGKPRSGGHYRFTTLKF